eukprot:TRINITY_DN3124_c0_g2_i15.p1 TRINITY_DN3124_c0_g2~~TRINITY_DN3124_c0_g2_i15.p1  ORF type:complete len:154 (-),score=35.21 TRINITY_DN3124_c0_g2_i15:62-460(-)
MCIRDRYMGKPSIEEGAYSIEFAAVQPQGISQTDLKVEYSIIVAKEQDHLNLATICGAIGSDTRKDNYFVVREILFDDTGKGKANILLPPEWKGKGVAVVNARAVNLRTGDTQEILYVVGDGKTINLSLIHI